MTKDELIAKQFASQLRIAKQDKLVDDIEADYDRRAKDALSVPREVLARLRDEDSEALKTCLHEVDFLPFKRYDFITRGDGQYYEVEHIELSLSSVEHDAVVPPEDFLRIYMRGFAIRKGGTLPRYASGLGRVSIHDMGGYRKAEMSEDIRLRRAIKQRMRRRLEGGD